MMCSLSLSPVMKMTGTWASALFCLRRRHVSKPSGPGMSASMRMTSGSTFSMMDSACSLSRATRTVIPASSIASVSILSVSGESSTTSTMFRVPFLFMVAVDLGAADLSAANCLQRRGVTVQVECIHDRAHLPDEVAAIRRGALDLQELVEDTSDVPDLAEVDQLVDVLAGRNRERR